MGAAVGREGMLTVIRDLQMKEPYVGSVQMVTGEIAEDLTAYFAQSEQTPTACALGVLVARDRTVQVAGGYLLQLLPNAPDAVIEALERGIRGAGAVTPMLERGMTPEEILTAVCPGMELKVLETTEVSYRCYCSRERVKGSPSSVWGKKELEEIAAEGRPSTLAASSVTFEKPCCSPPFGILDGKNSRKSLSRWRGSYNGSSRSEPGGASKRPWEV